MEIVRNPLSVERQIPVSPTSVAPLQGLQGPFLTPARKKVLVFDTDDRSCTVISETMSESDFDLVCCRDLAEVTDRILGSRNGNPEELVHLILWGLKEPFEEGLKDLREMREISGGVRIVLLADQEALAFASAIKSASVDAFILKPLHASDVRGGVERALKRPQLASSHDGPVDAGTSDALAMRERTESVISPIEDGRDLGLIGTSPEMRKIVALIRRVGTSSVNVLITGESGTGKEMVASAIHRVSDRARKPFIAINCAAIPRELLESELFGHAKGAFTGATSARRGLFEEAHEGTILLDEIGDLPLPLQAKILRLLQTKQVKPLGQNSVREVDVRIISATHKNLKTLIQKGEFREDLYYRLNVMPMHLPPLRDRKEDILLLAEHFLRRHAQTGKGSHRSLNRKAQAKLLNLPWKGNVRELENVVERGIVLSEGDFITESEILTEEMEPVRVTTEDLFNAGMILKDIEREYIKYVLVRTGNRKETATRIPGIDRKTLYRKEKVYGIR